MEFPPVNTTGNFRSLKHVKYLSQFGIEPIIVTFIAEEAAKFFNTKIDDQLMNELPDDCIVYRIHCADEKKSLLPKKWSEFIRIFFSIKDSLSKRWKPFLFKELDAIIKKHNPKLLYTSLPPFSSGMLTKDISDIYSIPYVLDMRDLWAFWSNVPFGSRIHFLLTLKEENKIYRNAVKVIGVTPQMVEILRQKNPGISRTKFEYISNGFDGDINSIKDFQFVANKQKIIIGYVGSFYYEPKGRNNALKPWWKKRGHKIFQYSPSGQDWLYRSPYFFLKSLAELILNYPHIGALIHVEFIGHRTQWLEDMVANFGLQNRVFFHGFVSQSQSFSIQQNWDFVLATSEKVIGGEHYCLPSKIFDYVTLSKPILGFVTEGIQKEFIEKSGLGIICDPESITDAVKAMVNLFKNGQQFKPNIEYLKNFQRISLANKLAIILKSPSNFHS